MIKYIVLVCFLLSVFREFCSSINHKGQLTRNFLFDNLLPSHTWYYIKFFENVRRTECALQCLLLKSGCAGILYNDKVFSCKLLKCHLNERSVNRTRVEVGWEFWSKNTICPIGWEPFEGQCYFLSKTKKTWNDSKEECEQYGAHLVEIATPAENTWLMEAFLPPWSDVDCSPWYRCCKCWTGATDMDSEGNFTWNRHTNITFSNWRPSEPDNHWGDEHCVSLCQNGLWSDSRCSTYRFFICEKK